MYQTKVNLLTKLMYIAAAISIPLISGRLWMFGVFIAVSLLVLASGEILKKTVPLIFPVVMRFLINTRERAIALEVRGFGAGKKKHGWQSGHLLRPYCRFDSYREHSILSGNERKIIAVFWLFFC